jgi:hypothetical protein
VQSTSAHSSSLTGERGTDFQRDFKGGRGLAAEDFQHLRAAESDGMVVPEQFGALADAKLALAFSGDLQASGADVLQASLSARRR